MKIFFPKRIAEPKIMDKVELTVFDQHSRANYNRWFIPLADDIQQYVKTRHDTILDVACGPGLLTKILAERLHKAQIYGLDYSLSAIKLSKKNCRGLKNTRFKLGNIYGLKYPDGFFDLVVCKDSFHHFSQPLKALKESLRVLKNGGALYLQDLRRDLPFYLLKKALPPDTTFKKLQYYSARAAYTKKEIKKILHTLKIKNFQLKTRRLNKQVAARYARQGIAINALRESFQSRYILIIKKS